MRYMVLLLTILSFCFGNTIKAEATDLPRLLIIGDDSNPQSLPRYSRPFNQVIDAISQSLLNEGFDVKDEAALSTEISDKTKRRSESEIIKKAKELGIDVAIIFSIYPNKQITENTVRVQPRVNGRLLSVFDGSRMGSFNLKSQTSSPIKKPFSQNEESEAVADISDILGREVGEVLAQRLSQYVDSEGGRLQEWDLTIDGFNNYQVMDMEDIFRKFTGYDAHRVKTNAASYRKHSEFFYKSSADSAKLKRDFTRMLKKLGLKGTITISGLKITIAKNKGLKSRILQQNSW
jgi:hypothetical protein